MTKAANTPQPAQPAKPAKPVKKSAVLPVIHTIIGLCIMFSGHFLPCPSLVVEATEKLQALNLPEAPGGGLTLSVTRIGMIVSMTFFGVIYLWTFVNTLWPGLVGIIALIFSGFVPNPQAPAPAANQIMAQFLGNPMVVMLFFLFMVAAAIVYCGLAGWLAHYLMTRDFVKGRPWVLTATILITTYLVAFLDQVSSMFLMWPILYAIYKQWCEDNAMKPLSARTVSSTLNKHAAEFRLEHDNHITNRAGKRVNGFWGIEALISPTML